MNNIEVRILNEEAVAEAEKLMVMGARLTQRSQKISDMSAMLDLYHATFSDSTVSNISSLPHPNIQRLGMVAIALTGVSRRFWSQFTRHQDDVHFVGGSLQYNDYTDSAAIVVPYEILKLDAERVGNAEYEEGYFRRNFLNSARASFTDYEKAIKNGVPHDAAAYLMPFGVRQVAIVAATAWQWRHMISQRVCRRNSLETQYVLLRCWEELDSIGPIFEDCGPFCCQRGGCREGKFCCGHLFMETAVLDRMDKYKESLPTAFLNVNFPLLRQRQLEVSPAL